MLLNFKFVCEVVVVGRPRRLPTNVSEKSYLKRQVQGIRFLLPAPTLCCSMPR